MESYTGAVQEGSRRASGLGYPTVNIELPKGTVSGVYAGRVCTHDGAVYDAAVFADPHRMVLEAHLLDYDGDLYGTDISIELHKKLRDSQMFESDDALRTAIAEDVENVRQYFTQ